MLEGKAINGPLQPLSNFVLVEVREAKAQTLGGIVLPDQAKEKPTEGTVVATGPGRVHLETNVLIPMPVAIGGRVLYGKFDGSKVRLASPDDC
jgi:chaperonin GroES